LDAMEMHRVVVLVYRHVRMQHKQYSLQMAIRSLVSGARMDIQTTSRRRIINHANRAAPADTRIGLAGSNVSFAPAAIIKMTQERTIVRFVARALCVVNLDAQHVASVRKVHIPIRPRNVSLAPQGAMRQMKDKQNVQNVAQVHMAQCPVRRSPCIVPPVQQGDTGWILQQQHVMIVRLVRMLHQLASVNARAALQARTKMRADSIHVRIVRPIIMANSRGPTPLLHVCHVRLMHHSHRLAPVASVNAFHQCAVLVIIHCLVKNHALVSVHQEPIVHLVRCSYAAPEQRMTSQVVGCRPTASLAVQGRLHRIVAASLVCPAHLDTTNHRLPHVAVCHARRIIINQYKVRLMPANALHALIRLHSLQLHLLISFNAYHSDVKVETIRLHYSLHARPHVLLVPTVRVESSNHAHLVELQRRLVVNRLRIVFNAYQGDMHPHLD